MWQDAARCVAYLPKSSSGTLESPRISEEGRQFLANLLVQLTDVQLHDLFEVARFPDRWDATRDPQNAAFAAVRGRAGCLTITLARRDRRLG